MDRVDLNSDLGESFGRYTLGLDAEVIPLVSSVNIACGMHAGDPDVMRRTVKIAADAGEFTIDDVCADINAKMIRRHPHVFGEVEVSGVGDVLNNWDAIKRRSKGQKKGSEPMLSIPRELPALMRATKIQQKAAAVGFDWDDVSGAQQKVLEEAKELSEAIESGDKEHISEELGDLLFSAVNVSRFVKCDAEEALTAASDKFIARFIRVEQLAREHGIDMESAPLEKLDELWDEAKAESGK